MKFFFDRSAAIGLAKVVRAIDEKNHVIVHHDEDERFNENTTDIEWMRTISGDGVPAWIIVSGDGRILKNRHGPESGNKKASRERQRPENASH